MNNNELRKQCSQYLDQLNEEAQQCVLGLLARLCQNEINLKDTPSGKLEELKQLRKAKQLQEEQKRKAELQAVKEESQAAFDAWVKKHKASFELTKLPSGQCIGIKDIQIMKDCILSQLGFAPSSEAIDALYKTFQANYVYGFRRGKNYANSQLKKESH